MSFKEGLEDRSTETETWPLSPLVYIKPFSFGGDLLMGDPIPFLRRESPGGQRSAGLEERPPGADLRKEGNKSSRLKAESSKKVKRRGVRRKTGRDEGLGTG